MRNIQSNVVRFHLSRWQFGQLWLRVAQAAHVGDRSEPQGYDLHRWPWMSWLHWEIVIAEYRIYTKIREEDLEIKKAERGMGM